MPLRLSAAVALVCCAFSVTGVACASSVSTYQVLNQAGTTTLGTITLDTASGTLDSLDLGLQAGGNPVSFAGAPTQQGFYPYLDDYRAVLATTGYELIFSLPVTSLVNYDPADRVACKTSAVDCDFLANLYAGPISSADLVSTFEGNLVAAPATAMTPEPGSLALFATGVLGLAGALRRRRA